MHITINEKSNQQRPHHKSTLDMIQTARMGLSGSDGFEPVKAHVLPHYMEKTYHKIVGHV